MNDHRSSLGDFTIITVRPNIGIPIKVSTVIAFTVRVIPETYGGTGKWRGADQLTFLGNEWLTVIVPKSNIHTQSNALNFAGVNGQYGIAQNEARDNIGPTADRRQAQIALKGLIYPLKTMPTER